MANIKGIGPCAIPGENGLPCTRQIQEGEPIGSVTAGNAMNPQSVVGHKRCADAWYSRKQQREKERNLAMVQRVNQDGPGGAVDMNKGYDAVKGSIPLEPQSAPPQTPGVIQGDMSEGAYFMGDIPEGVTPGEAVRYAKGEPIKVTPNIDPSQLNRAQAETANREDAARWAQANLYQQGNRPQSQPILTAQQSYAKGILGDPLPRVDAQAGRVVLQELHVRPDGSIHLDPEDGEDLIELLRVNVGRARRQL